jgi:tetratricopeptide (TPR) repeat protein
MPENLTVVDTVPTVAVGEIIQSEVPVSERKAGGTRRVWRWAKLWGVRAFAFSTSISTLVLAGWGVWLIGDAMLRKLSLDIESIGVPQRLTDDGYSAEVVTRRLRDAIKKVQANAKTTMARLDVHEHIADVTIPKAGISAESVAGLIRPLLPESWLHVISGEFVMSGAELTVRLRLNGEVVFSDASTSDAVDGLIDKAALKLVERTQPYIAASSLFKAGDLSGAVRLSNQIIASLPPDDESVMRAYTLKGLIAEGQQDDEKAAAFYLKYPNFALARYNLGRLRYKQHRLEEAISEYRLAIQLDPKDGPPHNNLGNALRDQDKTDEAISEYRLAIQLDPKDTSPHYNLGNALADQGKTDEAISEYRLAIRLDPKYALPHNNLGNALRDQRNRDEAISEYRLAIELDPKAAPPHYNLGNALRDQGKTDEAIGEYRRAVELDPKAALPHYNLATTLDDQGKTDEAISEYRLAIELDPKSAFPHNGLGTALREQGKTDEAMGEYRLAIELDPKDAAVHYNLEELLAEQVGPETPQDRAVRLLTEACEQILLGARLAPNDPDYPVAAHRIDAKFAGRGHCPGR